MINGDADPDDPDVQTFQPLFPRGKYFGELTPIGPVNLVHVNPYVLLRPWEGLQVGANAAFYWRASDDDGVYGFGGTDLLRADGGSDARYVGTQAELLVEWQVDRHLWLSTSWSVFTAGAFVRETGRAETMKMVAGEVGYRF